MRSSHATRISHVQEVRDHDPSVCRSCRDRSDRPVRTSRVRNRAGAGPGADRPQPVVCRTREREPLERGDQDGLLRAVATGRVWPPRAGQALEVNPVGPVATPVAWGFTGTARQIDATYAISNTLEILLASFSSYYVNAPLSTSLSFPCSGSSVIPFTPVDGGPLARPWNTTVTFLPQP